MKLLVKRSGNYLIPVFSSDSDLLKDAKLKQGEIYEVEIKKKRNYEFHKKYFALINLCFDNQECFELFDDLRDYLTVKAGYYRKVTMPNGYEDIKPKSISFANMDEIEFNKLYSCTLDVILKFLNCKNEDLQQQLINYM